MEEIKKIFTQTSWQIIGRLIGILSTFIVLSIVAHNYGQEGTGIFTLAASYLMFFFLAADLGLNGYILPRLQEHPHEANLVFNFRLWWSIVLMILATALTPLLPFGNPQFNFAVLLGAVTIIFFTIHSSTNLIFQSKLKYHLSTIAASCGFLVVIPAIFALNYLQPPVSVLILATCLGWLVNNILSLLLVKKLHKFKIEKINFNFVFLTLKAAWPITLTLLLNTLYFRIDAFILTSLKSFAEVGIYNVAFQVFQNAITIPTFIINSFYPMMINVFRQSRHQFFYQVKVAAAGLFFLSIMGLILGFIAAPWIINILAGSGFEGSIEALRILAISFPAFFLTALSMWIFVLIGRQKIMFGIYLFGLIVNAVLNFLFIPEYSYLAAAWITVVSEYLILILQLIILWKEFKKWT